MNLKANEAENRDYLLEKIKIKIAKSLPENILIEKEVPVPYKHIYLPKAITNELENVNLTSSIIHNGLINTIRKD
jgi:hypothetical protein